MKKAELVDAFKEATGLTRAQAGEFLERLGDIMATELLGGGEVPLPHIGKLVIKDTAARKGRNPQTGAAITIAAGKKAVIAMSKEFKESLK